MQTILENKDERSNSQKTSSMGTIICTKRISQYLEGKFVGEFGSAREFLLQLKKKFGGEDKELVKVAELKYGGRTIEEFV